MSVVLHGASGIYLVIVYLALILCSNWRYVHTTILRGVNDDTIGDANIGVLFVWCCGLRGDEYNKPSEFLTGTYAEIT